MIHKYEFCSQVLMKVNLTCVVILKVILYSIFVEVKTKSILYTCVSNNISYSSAVRTSEKYTSCVDIFPIKTHRVCVINRKLQELAVSKIQTLSN